MRRRHSLVAPLLGLILLAAVPSRAQAPVPVGELMELPTDPPDPFLDFPGALDMDFDPLGNGFLVWEHRDPNNASLEVRGRHHDVESGFGPVQRLPISFTQPARDPRVGLSLSGEAIVTWVDSLNRVSFRRYDPAGLPLADPVHVHRLPNDTFLVSSRVAVNPDGSFVLVWSSSRFAPDGGVFTRRFDAAGAPLGPIVRLDADGIDADVSMDGAGNHVLVWNVGVPGELGVVARLFDGEGMARGGVFTVAEPDTEIRAARVSMAPDGWFVVFHRTAARLFRPDGTPAGPGIEVGLGRGFEYSVALRSDHLFQVAWTDGVSGPVSLFTRTFDESGPLSPIYELLSGVLDGTSVSLTRDEQPIVLTASIGLSRNTLLAQEFDDPCRAGNVNAGIGRVRPQLLINGSPGGPEGTVTVGTGEPITLEILDAPATPGGGYVLYVWNGPPTGSCESVRAVPGLSPGSTLNPTPLRPDLGPQPRFCVPGAAIPPRACGGVSVRPGPATTPVLLTHPGLAAERTLTLQALQEDDGSLAPELRFSVTNGVTLRIVRR